MPPLVLLKKNKKKLFFSVTSDNELTKKEREAINHNSSRVYTSNEHLGVQRLFSWDSDRGICAS